MNLFSPPLQFNTKKEIKRCDVKRHPFPPHQRSFVLVNIGHFLNNFNQHTGKGLVYFKKIDLGQLTLFFFFFTSLPLSSFSFI